MAKKIFSIIVLACLLAGLGLIANKGLARHEELECQQWQQNSKEYQNWYSTKWQQQQCLNYGIELEK